jgi:hypothetical protein
MANIYLMSFMARASWGRGGGGVPEIKENKSGSTFYLSDVQTDEY